jgi:hypothetical protein
MHRPECQSRRLGGLALEIQPRNEHGPPNGGGGLASGQPLTHGCICGFVSTFLLTTKCLVCVLAVLLPAREGSSTFGNGAL